MLRYGALLRRVITAACLPALLPRRSRHTYVWQPTLLSGRRRRASTCAPALLPVLCYHARARQHALLPWVHGSAHTCWPTLQPRRCCPARARLLTLLPNRLHCARVGHARRRVILRRRQILQNSSDHSMQGFCLFRVPYGERPMMDDTLCSELGKAPGGLAWVHCCGGAWQAPQRCKAGVGRICRSLSRARGLVCAGGFVAGALSSEGLQNAHALPPQPSSQGQLSAEQLLGGWGTCTWRCICHAHPNWPCGRCIWCRSFPQQQQACGVATGEASRVCTWICDRAILTLQHAGLLLPCITGTPLLTARPSFVCTSKAWHSGMSAPHECGDNADRMTCHKDRAPWQKG